MEIPKGNWRNTHWEKLEEARLAGDKEDFETTWKLANQVCSENFDEPSAIYLLSYVAMHLEQYGLAYNLLRIVTQLVPNQPEPWNNMGMCFSHRWANDDDLAQAERCFLTAHKLDPEDKHALSNLSLVSIHKYDPGKAVYWANKALEKDPEMIEARDNRALAYLMMGEWTKGWADYERALGNIEERKERIFVDEPRWDGSKGKNVVVYGTQGIGDEISFASIIPDVIRDSKEVVIECDRRLEGLFKRSFPEASVYGTRFKTKELHWLKNHQIDARCSLDMLGKFYRNKDEDFPGQPYLKADPERRLQWRALLESLGDKPKIGIAWTGGLPRTGTQKRSLHLTDFLPIFNAIDATWVSLQYKDPSKEVEALQKEHGITVHHWPRVGEAFDLDELAAAVSELDLVITVTTAVVHLSGALGKEAWVLAPRKSRWFYRLEGETIPWYKSVRIFRRDKGDWPINDIVKRLRLRYGQHYRENRQDNPGNGGPSKIILTGT